MILRWDENCEIERECVFWFNYRKSNSNGKKSNRPLESNINETKGYSNQNWNEMAMKVKQTAYLKEIVW